MSDLVLFRRTLADRRRWLMGWSIGIVSLVVLTLSFWPSFGDKATDLNDVIDKLPDSVRSLFGMGGGVDPFSPIGYLSSQVYALMLPVLLLIAGIGLAASLAGDEEHGVLETTFSLPVGRRQVVVERWLALVVLTGLLNLLTLVSVLTITRIVDLAVGAGALMWATVSASLLTWSLAGLAMAAGAVTGRRSIAITVASVVAVTSYVITSLADAGIGFFETLKPISLFTHYDVLHTLVGGTPPWSLLVLAVVSVLGLAVALWGIDRRDLRAG